MAGCCHTVILLKYGQSAAIDSKFSVGKAGQI